MTKKGTVRSATGVEHLSREYAGAFIGLVRAGETLSRDLDGELREAHGLTLRAFEVLLFLGAFSPNGTLRMSELTERAPLSQSRVSRLVAELDARGLVTRSGAADDGRGVEVTITAAGRRALIAAQATHLAGLRRRLFDRLSEAEIRALARITEKILAPDS